MHQSRTGINNAAWEAFFSLRTFFAKYVPVKWLTAVLLVFLQTSPKISHHRNSELMSDGYENRPTYSKNPPTTGCIITICKTPIINITQNIHSGIHANGNRDVCRCLVACEDDKFDCGNGRCISMSQVCDYFDNCIDEPLLDETNCSHPSRQLCLALIRRVAVTNNL